MANLIPQNKFVWKCKSWIFIPWRFFSFPTQSEKILLLFTWKMFNCKHSCFPLYKFSYSDWSLILRFGIYCQTIKCNYSDTELNDLKVFLSWLTHHYLLVFCFLLMKEDWSKRTVTIYSKRNYWMSICSRIFVNQSTSLFFVLFEPWCAVSDFLELNNYVSLGFDYLDLVYLSFMAFTLPCTAIVPKAHQCLRLIFWNCDDRPY